MSRDRCDCGFVEPLLRWWRMSRRPEDYPWRNERDPYRVLLAEILLQRTRRDKVTEVYRELVSRYPRPEDLASADPEEVRRVIRPLGLEKRSEYLVKLAREMIRRRDIVDAGKFEELPGVGPYVAAAARTLLLIPTDLIPDASIARLFSRLFARPLNPRRPADTPWVRECLNYCAPRDPVERRNYFLALVDHAWEVCKPRRPECDRCPLLNFCRTVRIGDRARRQPSTKSRAEA